MVKRLLGRKIGVNDVMPLIAWGGFIFFDFAFVAI